MSKEHSQLNSASNSVTVDYKFQICPVSVKPSSFSFLHQAHPTVYQTQFVVWQCLTVCRSFDLVDMIANPQQASCIDLVSCELVFRILGLVPVICKIR